MYMYLLLVEGRFICDDIDYDAIDTDVALDVSFVSLFSCCLPGPAAIKGELIW